MLPDVRRLNREDFQNAPDWLDPMLNVLNSFMDSVYNIMNRNVSLTQNLNFQIYSMSLETDSNGDIKPLKIKTTVRGKVVGIIPVRIISTDTSLLSPFIYFTQSEDTLTITNIANLNNDQKYKIIVLIVGE